MATIGSKETCALALLLIALADISIVLDIPVLRQVFGFILLVILPGFLLIQIARLNKEPVERAMFLIGLSISFLMFVTLAINFVYPILGISRPISLFPLAGTFSLILIGLSLVAYKTGALDLQVTINLRTVIEKISSPFVLGAGLILVLSILGALLIRFNHNSLFSLFSVLSIAVAVVFLIGSRAPPWMYPLYIFAIALAIQFSSTLTSPNLFTPDVHYELFFANLVKANGYWNPNFAIADTSLSDYYAMLSVTLLPNVFSITLNADTVWIYKLILPFIFAFVPVGVYQLSKTQLHFRNKSAFLSAFFFMSLYVFVFQWPRQQVAQLFLILVVMMIVGGSLRGVKTIALLIIFVGSMVVSHYTTFYIFLFYVAVLLIGSALIALKSKQKHAISSTNVTRTVLAVALTILAVVLCVGWYVSVSGGAPLASATRVIAQVVETFTSGSFLTDMDPSVVVGLGGGIVGLSFTHALAHLWVIGTEVLITVGLGLMIWRRHTLHINPPFLLLSLASFLTIGAIAVPPIAAAVGSARLYFFASILLAPYCIFGIKVIVDTVSKRANANRASRLKLQHIALIGVLVPYFLFNSGFIFELTEHPANYAFLPFQTQSEPVIRYSHLQDWSYRVLTPVPTEAVYATKWLSNVKSNKSFIYTDSRARAEVVGDGQISPDVIKVLYPININYTFSPAYVYLGAENVQNKSVALRVPFGFEEVSVSSLTKLATGNRVYSNGLAQVYYIP